MTNLRKVGQFFLVYGNLTDSVCQISDFSNFKLPLKFRKRCLRNWANIYTAVYELSLKKVTLLTPLGVSMANRSAYLLFLSEIRESFVESLVLHRLFAVLGGLSCFCARDGRFRATRSRLCNSSLCKGRGHRLQRRGAGQFLCRR